MTTIAPTQDNLSTTDLHNLVVVATWTPLGSGDDGRPIGGSGWSDRSIQIVGTFGPGGTVVFEGSNDGVNYHTLNDPFAVPLSFTSAGLRAITEVCRYIRPRVTGGDGSTSITAIAVVRRAVP